VTGKEILLITFAAHKIHRLAESLASASRRGVRVRLVLEFGVQSQFQLSHDALKAFPSDLHWPPCSRAAIHCCWRASAPPGIYASNTFRWACRGRAGGTLRTFATIALPADSRTLRFYSRHEGVSHQTELRQATSASRTPPWLCQDGDVAVGGSAEYEPTTECRYPLAASPEPARSGLHRCQQTQPKRSANLGARLEGERP
jgi:hypothetical protein